MSRVYFHTRQRDAELRGSERAWLGHVAAGPARAAWDLDRASGVADRAREILALVPEVPDGQYGSNYLHNYLRQAIAEDEHNRDASRGDARYRSMTFEAQHRLGQALRTSMAVSGVKLHIGDVRLHSGDVDLNTALAFGSEEIALAAKIHGWCESHLWIDGCDRKWLADLIDRGLSKAIFRKGIWYEDYPEAGQRKWSSQGWEDVAELLRETEDGPVVLSYSVCDSFPNAEVSTWMPAWPDGVEHRWDALSEEQQREREERQEAWYELPDDERWDRAMEGLRASKPWLRLSPETLTETTFYIPVTVYDILAPDRDERIAAAVARVAETKDVSDG